MVVGVLFGIIARATDYSTYSVTGSWTNDAVWQNGSAPASYDNNSITINGLIVYSGNLSLSGNFQGLTVNDTLVIDGDFDIPTMGSVTVAPDGLLLIKGNFYKSDQRGLSISTGGKIVVYGDAEIYSEVNLAGQLIVSGSLTNGGGNTFNLTGDVLVGGDLNLGANGNVTFATGSNINVLGNATIDSGNIDQNQHGNVVVDGTTDCASCAGRGIVVDDTFTGVEPINFVEVGIDIIALIGNFCSVSGPQTDYATCDYGPYPIGCYLGISLTSEYTSTGDVTFRFEYSTNGSDWFEYASDVVWDEDVYVRLFVLSMDAGATLDITSVIVSGTNEGGAQMNSISWDSYVDELCPIDTVGYSISNFSDYDNVSWSVTAGTGTIIGPSNGASCNVRWEVLPGTIQVTGSKMSCGFEVSSVSDEINVTQTQVLSLSYSKADLSCFGANNGTIDVTAMCGPAGAVTYDWDIDPDPGNVSSLSGLSAGSYSVTVEKGTESVSETITIDEPSEISVGVTSDPYYCVAGTGTASVVVSGGTADYTITLSGATSGSGTTSSTYDFSNLNAGKHYIDVTDASGCTMETDSFNIIIDAEDPTFDDFPADVSIDINDYNANNSTGVTAWTDPNASYPAIGSSGEALITETINLSNFANPEFLIGVATNGVTPTVSDEIIVSISYNNGSSFPEVNTYTAISSDLYVPVTLDIDPSLNGEVQIKVEVVISTPSLIYTFSGLSATANERVHEVDASVYGSPSGCGDDVSGCISLTYTDDPPVWSCFGAGVEEFYIDRVWVAEDDCGKTTSRTQRISVGTTPVFDMSSNANLIVGYCDSTLSITGPDVSDVCSPPVTLLWEIWDAGNTQIGSGSDNIVDFDFPVGETSVVYWIGQDGSGVSDTVYQNVTVNPYLNVAITSTPLPSPSDEANICAGTNVQFELLVTGGSGTYTNYDFTPNGGSWSDPVYTTSDLSVAQDHLEVIITDSDNCVSEAFLSGTYNIHPNITTNPIGRN